jgi:hypothetical protein
MVFRTSWKPTDAADALEKIAKSGSLPMNVHHRVETDPDGRGGMNIHATSTKGVYHDTGVHMRVRPDENGRGSIITVEGDSKTPESEARTVEEKLREEYFR